MTLLVKDANTTVQSLSTELDGSGNLVPVHAPALVSAGVASPVGPQNPLPVINTAGAAASDGSGTVATGGSPQALFGGAALVNTRRNRGQAAEEHVLSMNITRALALAACLAPVPWLPTPAHAQSPGSF